MRILLGLLMALALVACAPGTVTVKIGTCDVDAEVSWTSEGEQVATVDPDEVDQLTRSRRNCEAENDD